MIRIFAIIEQPYAHLRLCPSFWSQLLTCEVGCLHLARLPPLRWENLSTDRHISTFQKYKRLLWRFPLQLVSSGPSRLINIMEYNAVILLGIVDVVALFSECSFELHNHSSGVTCGWFSWPEDQSSTAYLCERLLLNTKARAVRPSLCVADLRHPSRLRREPTQPQQTHCWTTSNTALGSELHYLTWKTKICLCFEPDVSFDAMQWPIWAQSVTLHHDVQCNTIIV